MRATLTLMHTRRFCTNDSTELQAKVIEQQETQATRMNTEMQSHISMTSTLKVRLEQSEQEVTNTRQALDDAETRINQLSESLIQCQSMVADSLSCVCMNALST
jgi:septal ring factor EnvC (AmiA/AmiB activator)